MHLKLHLSAFGTYYTFVTCKEIIWIFRFKLHKTASEIVRVFNWVLVISKRSVGM